MRVRPVAAGVLLASMATAADARPRVVTRVGAGVCFDGHELAHALKRRLADLDVAVGSGAGDLAVAVENRAGAVSLRMARSARVEQRQIAFDGDCPALLDTVAAIVVRAATPLALAEPPPPRKTDARVAPKHAPPAVATKVPSPPAPPAPRTPPAPAPPPPPPPPAPPAPVVVAAPPTATPTAIAVHAAAPPAAPGHVDLLAGFRYVVPLDGNGAGAGALVVVDAHLRRWLVVAGAGFETASDAAAGPGRLAVRRYPLRLGGGYELPLGRGALRVEAGALAVVWTADSTGIAHPAGASLVGPGAYASLGYRLRLARHLHAYVAVDGEAAFVRESLLVTGAGEVATTPTWWIAPQLGFATDFL